jgi:dihydrofolate reductase
MVEYSLIAAVSDNNVIGCNGDIPWRIKEDWALFKKSTLDSVIIMGKGTWDSLPKRPLPNRINIVLARENFEAQGAIVALSFEKALEEAAKHKKPIFVIGGGSVYSQTIENAKWLYLSHVKGEYEGDVFFPKFDKENYNIIEEKDFGDFIFKKYEKK